MSEPSLQLDAPVRACRRRELGDGFCPGATGHPGKGVYRVVVVYGDELEGEPVGAEGGDPGVGDGGSGAGAVGDRSGGAVLEDVG